MGEIHGNLQSRYRYMPCRYSEIFGKVGEGAHAYRVFDVAIVDVIFTIIGAYIIHLFLPQYKFIHILVALFALGIALHRLFCVRTTIDKALFWGNQGS
jgi:uncharacterized membrane protein